MAPSRIDTIARVLSSESNCNVGRGYGRLTYQQPRYRQLGRVFWGAKLMKFPDYSKCRLRNAEYAAKRLLELPTDGRVDEEKATQLSQDLIHELKSR